VLVGLVVTSPPTVATDRQFGGSSTGEQPTMGRATFDNVRVDPVRPDTPWDELSRSALPDDDSGGTETAGTFTVTGSGEIAVNPPDTDVPLLGLVGVQAGQIAIIVVAVLFITTEYQRGMIRTTFVATPRRGRVLAAKALVIGGTSFGTGLIAAILAFVITQPILRSNGFGPPAYPVAALLDWPVLRAILGAGTLLALVSVFSLAVGVILRRSAIAVAGLIVLIMAPIFVANGLPVTTAHWLVRSTPTAGLALMQTMEPDRLSVEAWSLVSPGEGLAVLSGYTAVALAVAYWLLRRRDA
jgi:ABC-type transport system involved in multi-copper enzyme maturation permease subunit